MLKSVCQQPLKKLYTCTNESVFTGLKSSKFCAIYTNRLPKEIKAEPASGICAVPSALTLSDKANKQPGAEQSKQFVRIRK